MRVNCHSERSEESAFFGSSLCPLCAELRELCVNSCLLVAIEN
jgi:hypothetical protein